MKTKRLLLTLAIAAVGIAALSFAAPKAQALNGSDFNPGRIIDDSVFYNKDAMSVNDIQNFLYAKSGPCDTNRPTTNSNYQPPWTCLYQYRENTTTKENNIGAPSSNPAGSITGAQIIYDAAQAYNISPKALIVLIQKESSLITDNWPWSNQYRTATGYGCPDGSPCDSQYYGFYNQVNKAAFQLRRYATYPSEYNVRAGRNNNISYHPSGNCGAQTVYVQNAATAGLYNYTPYVPNAAALNNLYGTGDGCSAYGNRNFWRLYSDWFGSTTAPTKSWHYEVLDGAADSVSENTAMLGQSPAVIGYGSSTQTFYYDAQNGNLRHAWADSTGWHFENLDGDEGSIAGYSSDVGRSVVATVFGTQLHLFYYDAQNGNLRHAWAGSSGWQFEDLDGAGGTNGRVNADTGVNVSVTQFNGEMRVFYYNQTAEDFRTARSGIDGLTWTFETLDGTSTIGGRVNTQQVGRQSTAIVYNGLMHVFYYDVVRGALRHAWNTGSDWYFEDLEGTGGSVSKNNIDIGQMPTATVYNNTLQVFYYDVQYGNMRHAWANSQGWKFENLEGDAGSVSRNNLNIGKAPTVTTYNGTLQAFYYDVDHGTLRHAWSGPSGWRFENLDGDTGSVIGNDLDVGAEAYAAVANNVLQLTYYDTSSKVLRHAWPR